MKSIVLLLGRVSIAPVLSSIVVAATPPVSSASRNDPIALSPFVVEEMTDTGYAATNSLEGSRLNTSLRDTPGGISIFTKDLLDGLGVTSIDEFLRYDVNADMTFGGDDAVGAGSQDNMFGDQGLTFSVPGLPGTSSVDGFQNSAQPNTYMSSASAPLAAPMRSSLVPAAREAI